MKTISRRSLAGTAALTLACALLTASAHGAEIKWLPQERLQSLIWNWRLSMNARPITNC